MKHPEICVGQVTSSPCGRPCESQLVQTTCAPGKVQQLSHSHRHPPHPSLENTDHMLHLFAVRKHIHSMRETLGKGSQTTGYIITYTRHFDVQKLVYQYTTQYTITWTLYFCHLKSYCKSSLSCSFRIGHLALCMMQSTFTSRAWPLDPRRSAGSAW